MFEAKRVLLITREVKFAANATSALDKVGYKITAFTNSRPALDFLRVNPQDIAVLDFRVNDMPAPDTIDHMRAMIPKIVVIAAPNHPAVHGLKEKHNLQAIINLPYPLKRFVRVLEAAFMSNQASEPSDKDNKKKSSRSERANDNPMIEFWVSSQPKESPKEKKPTPKADKPDDLRTEVFDKLAAEEPPMPSVSEGSTVRDLRDFLTDSKNLRKVLEVFSDDSTAKNALLGEKIEPNEDSRSIPAAMILEAAMDESTPIRTFSLNEFMSRAQDSGKEIYAPPSWLEEEQKYFREPGFLPDDLPRIPNTFEYTITKTTPNEAQINQIEHDPSNLVTDQIEPVSRSRPPQSLPEFPADTSKGKPQELPSAKNEDEIDTSKNKPIRKVPLPPSLPEFPPKPVTEILNEDEAAEHSADFEKIKVDTQKGKVAPDKEPVADVQSDVPFADYDKSNPYVAQLALKLTQMSLETSAEASVLLENGKLAAYAGNLPREDIEELRNILNKRGISKSGKSQVGFITLESSGIDYMLFTLPTDSGHLLAMIFSGMTRVDVIREQGRRLGEALAVVPQLEFEPEITVEEQATQALRVIADEDIGERAPFTFVWMLQDDSTLIRDEVAQTLIKGLDMQLAQSGWNLHDLNVHQDYVYIYGEMPTMLEAKQVIHDLMQSSADMLADKFHSVDAAKLWHDSYLVLQPGREMNTAEIEMFVNFARE